jgi:hypothetical protein
MLVVRERERGGYCVWRGKEMTSPVKKNIGGKRGREARREEK